MPEFHRPDYHEGASNAAKPDSAGSFGKASVKEQVLPSDAKTWPFIDLEDLAKPKCLLTFLNSRGRNLPYVFAPTEEIFSPLGTMSPCGPEPEIEKYVLYFSKTLDPALYGKVGVANRVINEYTVSGTGSSFVADLAFKYYIYSRESTSSW